MRRAGLLFKDRLLTEIIKVYLLLLRFARGQIFSTIKNSVIKIHRNECSGQKIKLQPRRNRFRL